MKSPFKKTPGVTYSQDKSGYQPNPDVLKLRPPSKNPGKPVDRPLPVVYQKVIKVEWLRTFSWRERFAILFGHNLVVMIGLATQHSPGQFQPMILGKVTEQPNADEYMKTLVENMIEARGVAPSPIEHEPKPEEPKA